MGGVKKAGPAAADEGERRKGRWWDPGEAFQNDVIGERGNVGGGDRKSRGGGMVGLGRNGGGLVRIRETCFHDPCEMAGITAISL